MSDLTESNTPAIEQRRSSVLTRISQTLVVAFAMLSFPSVLPWMVACWLLCHTALAKWRRPAWVPLLICLLILVVKLVPRTPALMVFGLLLVVVIAMRWKRKNRPEVATRWWLGPAILWIAWGFLLAEWRAIESCGRELTFDKSRPIVCIGDSLTEGMIPDHGYPEQLKSLTSASVINLGFSGISSTQGLGQMPRVLKHNPQVVVIELGGHDFLKGHGRATAKRNLVEMIRLSREAGAEAILMEIPRGFIFDPFASLEREIAYEHDVQLVSDTWLRQIVILSPVVPPAKWFQSWQLSDDGIHSNPKGSLAIARRVANALHAMFGDDVLVSDARK